MIEPITLREAAEMLRLHPKTITRGLAGTGTLTLVRQGKLIFLDRKEVEKHLKDLFDAAKKQQGKYRFDEVNSRVS